MKDRHLISAENDPDYLALLKMGRQSNVFSKIFWRCFFISIIVWIFYFLMCVADPKLFPDSWTGYLAMSVPSIFGFLSIVSERFGELAMDWNDARTAKKQTDALIARLNKSK